MAGPQYSAIMVNKWEVGMTKDSTAVIMQFPFADHDPVTLHMARDEAEQMAQAILDQVANKPIDKGGLN